MKILAPPSAPELRLLSAGRFKMKSLVAGSARSRQAWVLELITAGQLEVSVQNGAWQTLGQSGGVLYAPGTCYRERVTAPGEICRSIALFFEVSTLPPQRAWERFKAPYFVICDEEKLLAPLAERTLHHLGLGAADDLLATGCFLELMAHLLRAEVQQQTLLVTREYSGGDLVSSAHRCMRARLAEALSLPEIAAEVGLSVSGFAHAYKRQTGLSPMAALRQMRVEAAKSQLLRDRLSLAQIAEETGFADAFHLSRTFKQITGLSPRQFRRRVLEPSGRTRESGQESRSLSAVPDDVSAELLGARREF